MRTYGVADKVSFNTDNFLNPVTLHCQKYIQVQICFFFFFSVPFLNTEIYHVNICIQSEYGCKIRTNKNSPTWALFTQCHLCVFIVNEKIIKKVFLETGLKRKFIFWTEEDYFPVNNSLHFNKPSKWSSQSWSQCCMHFPFSIRWLPFYPAPVKGWQG